VGCYGRRTATGEQFSDAKGVRFGLKLKRYAVRRAGVRRAHVFTVRHRAPAVDEHGHALEAEEPNARPRSKQEGARLSPARIGSGYRQKMSGKVRLKTRYVREHPPLRLRVFESFDRSAKVISVRAHFLIDGRATHHVNLKATENARSKIGERMAQGCLFRLEPSG
jgi:hypothetical protein